ncbi:hypothetical protein ARMGADRAFT_938239, partial [Armillaria gallica]
LHQETVTKWMDSSRKRWSKTTVKNIECRHALAGTKRAGILGKDSDLVKYITNTLKDIQKSELPVSVAVRRAIMIAMIRGHDKTLLQHFKCSEKYVCAFYQSVLNWTPHAVTHVAAQIFENTSELCECAFFRLLYAIK